MAGLVRVKLDGPFNLPLSLEAAAAFLPATARIPQSLRLAIWVADRPAIIEIRQKSQKSATAASIEVSVTAAIPRSRLEELALWLTSGDLNLRQFYRITAAHPVMGPIAKRLQGLKPLRPVCLFEMAIIAITEQQLSLAAAFHIRKRLIERFGTSIEDLWIFPKSDVIADASMRDLRACGLSHRKAEYVRDFARCVANGELTFETLKYQTDAAVGDRLIRCNGFGPWSVQYVLLRGLGRYDSLPSDDVGLRRTVSMSLLHRGCFTPQQLERALSPFAPFRGLAAFYLSANFRLRQRETKSGRRPSTPATK